MAAVRIVSRPPLRLPSEGLTCFLFILRSTSIMSINHKEAYTKLLDDRADDSFHDDSNAASWDEASLQSQRHTPSSRSSFKKRILTAFLATIAVIYIFISLAFMLTTYTRGEYRLRAPSPPYSTSVRPLVTNRSNHPTNPPKPHSPTSHTCSRTPKTATTTHSKASPHPRTTKPG